ncbi:MAG: hypothetical protein BGO39_20740 [Chloroflexi bacterium 54-19]|nr:MAG: hypothetical protein BGO39_20740 [Chloroflexi bacterium 54-19]
MKENGINQVEATRLAGVNMSRLWDASHLVSMLVPEEWAVGRTEKFETIYIGPQTAGMQPNVGIAHTQLLRGNRLTIQLLGKQVLNFLQSTYNAFELLEEREVELDGTRPGLLRVFGWTDKETQSRVTQLMLLVADGNTLFDFTATIAKDAAKELLPVIKGMLMSVKFTAATKEKEVLPLATPAVNN